MTKQEMGKQIKELKEENNILSKINSRLSQGIYWGNGEQFCDVVKKLKQQLYELEEENNLLKTHISKFNQNSIGSSINNFPIATDEMRFNILNSIIDRNKELRTQLHEQPKKICDEIGKGLNRYSMYNEATNNWTYGVRDEDLENKLNEIQAKYTGIEKDDK